MQDAIQYLVNNVLMNPSILLGIVAAIGLIFQKKKIDAIIKGSLSAAFGMLILDRGVGIIVESISPINDVFKQTVSEGIQVTEGLSDVTFTTNFGGEIGLAMLVGFILHLLIAKFTSIKTVFLTGHMLWWLPFIFVAAGVEGGLRGWLLVLSGAIASALYWSFMPWIMKGYVKEVTEDDSFLIGHPTGILSLIAGYVSSKTGNKNKSTEDLNIPQSLSFFREISVTGAITIFIMYIILSILNPNIVEAEQSALIYSITQALIFAAGLIIMLQGVRMLINQIVPAFQGISDKLIEGAIPAFDVPLLFNYRPNAVIVGFIVSIITSTSLILVANVSNIFGIVLVPLVITSFFEIGGAAVIADAQGGLKGTIIGTAVASGLMVIIMGISATIYVTTIRNWILIFGGNDFSFFGPIVKWIIDIFKLILG